MKKEQVKDKLIVYFEGEINAKAGEEYKKEVMSLFDRSGVIVISFVNVGYLNSSGLREIIDLLKNANKAKKEIRLCEMPKDIREMFSFTGLEKVFKIFDTKAAALE